MPKERTPPSNVKMELKKSKLVIEVDVSKDLGPSASGKSNLVATTRGNVEIPGKAGMFIGLTVYTKRG